MITRELSSCGSAATSLDYNEKKVDVAEAFVVAVRNIKNGNKYSIYRSMEVLENNLRISKKTKNKGFHMAVCPGVIDDITENNVVNYIDEVMAELGFVGQPYVIYRHNDILREHFHVVSCRIKPDGHVVRDCFIHRKLMSIQDRLAEKYHYTPASKRDMLPDSEKENRLLNLSRINLPHIYKHDENKIQKSEEIRNLSREFFFASLEEYAALLRIMGLGIIYKSRSTDDKKNVFFEGLTPDGKKFAYINGNNEGGDEYMKISSCLIENELRQDSFGKEKIRLYQIIKFMLNHAVDKDNFISLTKSVGIYVDKSSNNSFYVVDTKTECVFNTRDLGVSDLTLDMMFATTKSDEAPYVLTQDDKIEIRNRIIEATSREDGISIYDTERFGNQKTQKIKLSTHKS